MRFRPPLRMSVIRRGEKEQRLGAFVNAHLADAQTTVPMGGHEILLIARSVESPVVKAIATLAPEIAAAGYTLRMIVVRGDRQALPGGWALSDSVDVDCNVRWARNPRLVEAHEQLVLGPCTCWTGDSMRRDPAKCDAYESYIADCSESAGSAAVSFERLWLASEPLLEHRPFARDTGESAAIERRH